MRPFDRNWRFGAILASLLIAHSASGAVAQDIAIIGPLKGTSDIVGKQMTAGVIAYDAALPVYNDDCDAASGKMAADTALALGAQFIVGLPCVEALDAAATVVQNHDKDTVIISLGVEVPDITSREKRRNWPVYRFAADANQEAETIANYIKSAWRNVDFAIIDDGTLYGRQFVEDVRFLLELDNLKPVFVDNYRPLLENQSGMLRRLQRSGASHVLVGGDAFDASIFGRGSVALGIRLDFAGGAAFLAPPEDGILLDGTIFAAPDRVSIKVDDVELTGYAATTYAALQIADQALKYATDKGVAPNLAMRVLRFETALGTVSFGNDGENTRDWYTTYKIEDGSVRKLNDGLQQ